MKEEYKDIIDQVWAGINYVQQYYEDWEKYYKYYRSNDEDEQTKDERLKHRSRIFIPLVYSMIESELPRLIANRPRIYFFPRRVEDVEKTKKWEAVLEYFWNRMRMDSKIIDWFRQMLIYGTGIMKVGWVKTQKINEPVIEIIPIFDFFIDPLATDLDNARWVAHRVFITKSEFEDRVKEGIYKKPEELTEVVGFLEDKPRRMEIIEDLEGKTINIEPKEDLVEVIEYWTKDRVITILNRTYVVRDEKNPYNHGELPFVVIRNVKQKEEFYGLSEVAVLEHLQRLINALFRMRIDNINVSLNRMWVAQKGAVNTKDLITRPNGVIQVSGEPKQVLMPLDAPDITSQLYRDLDFTRMFINEVTGINDVGRGTIDMASASATAVATAVETMNMRLMMKLRVIEEEGLKRLGEMLLSLFNQYLDPDFIIRIESGAEVQFETLGLEDFNVEVDVVVEAGGSMPDNRETRIKRALDLYQLMAGNPMVDQQKLLEYVLSAFGVDPRKFINPQQMMQMQQLPMQTETAPAEGDVASNAQQAEVPNALGLTADDIMRNVFQISQSTLGNRLKTTHLKRGEV